MTHEQKEILLRKISNWSTDDVVALLKKNKLSECCSAIVKRQVDGEELLHLSEGKLNLWKSDLTRSLRWALCRFVEDLIKNPKQYCPEEIRPISPVLDQSDNPSDTESWDTDFEEDDKPSGSAGEDSLHDEDHDDSFDMFRNGNITRPPNRVNPIIPENKIGREFEDNVNDNIYGNTCTSEVSMPVDTASSMVAQLKEQLLQMELKKKPSLLPKPNIMAKKPNSIESPMKKPNVIESPMKKPNVIESPMKKPNVIESPMKRQSSLHSQQTPRPVINSSKPTPNLESMKRIEAAKIEQQKKILFPPKPKITPPITPSAPGESKFEKFGKLQNLPQPPSTYPRVKDTKFTIDSLSEKADDSDEYDYEPINAQKNSEQHNSSESLVSARSGNSYHSPIASNSVDDSQEVYSVIPDTHDTNDEYEKPVCNSRSTPRPTMSGSMQKRPLDLRPSTVPIAGRQSSRPLPLPPINGPQADRPVEIPDRNFDAPSYTEKPWFHNIGREEAIALIEGGSSRFSAGPPDGYFLLRPSMANMNQPWTLVLWYKTKVYNIAVRKRPDMNYALGRVKPREQSFKTIEEMVSYYKQNELVLNSGSGDVSVGSTRLTETPLK